MQFLISLILLYSITAHTWFIFHTKFHCDQCIFWCIITYNHTNLTNFGIVGVPIPIPFNNCNQFWHAGLDPWSLCLCAKFCQNLNVGAHILCTYKAFKGSMLKVMKSSTCKGSLIEQWFSISVICLRWGGCYSHFFILFAGVRQGGVL